MRMSEAIRVGATRRPSQAFWQLYDVSTDATCVIGAAADALGLLDVPHNGYKPGFRETPEYAEWRWTVTARALCPACTACQGTPQWVMVHLNNDHRWTRERIADWVEAQERASVVPVGTGGTGEDGDAC